MLSGGSEPVEAYLGDSRAGLSLPGDVARWLVVNSVREGMREILKLVDGESDKKRFSRRRLNLWLSGAVARPFLFAPVAGLKHSTEAMDVAASLASDATGLTGPCSIWLDNWRPERMCLAVAMDRALRDEIESEMRKHSLKLAGIRPWWSAVLAASVRPPDPVRWLAVEDSDALTILSGTDGQFETAASYVPRPDEAQRQALLARALLGANGSAKRSLRVALGLGELPLEPAGPESLHVAFGARTELLS